MPFDYLQDVLGGRAPGTTKSVKALNQTHMTPAAKQAAALKAQSLKAPKGTGLGMTVASLIPKQAYDRVANEIVRGAVTVLGGDTTFMDARISGKPLVKSVGGTDFNVATNEGMAAYKKALNATKNDDPKKTPGGGLDTSTAKVTPPTAKPKTFQEHQQGLMGEIAKRYDDPQTAALIRGGPVNPFSSNQLPYTDDNLYTSFDTKLDSDFGIDTSKMLQRVGNINYSEVAKDLPGFDEGLTLKDSFTEGYVSPVNGTAPQNAGNPMLNPNIDSMHAIRMKDRDLGLMYASGQFFAKGKDGSPVLVNRKLAKSVRRGDEGAKDQLAAYLAGGGIKPQGGVIAEPKMEQMVPPKTKETQSTPTNGEFSSISASPTVDFIKTGAFDTNLSSGFFNEEPAMPDMSKKLGLSYSNPKYTDLFSRKPDPSDPFSSQFDHTLFKD